MGNSALFKGDFKALRLGAWLQNLGVEGAGAWKLYDIKEDPSELHDLSEQEPELLAELVANYAEYGGSLGIIDMPADFDPLAVIVGSE
jgi:arylsulfatase